MKWFRRKPKKFDYAAIRIGNVYVLPPDEDDVREFRQKRRKELTRRGFIVAGIGVALGAVALPFLPGKRNELDPSMLFSTDLATANPALLKRLCLYFYQHEDAEVRFQCARVMGSLDRDEAIVAALLKLAQGDGTTRVREKAADSLVLVATPADHAQIIELYRTNSTLRGAIDRAVDDTDHEVLRRALAMPRIHR